MSDELIQLAQSHLQNIPLQVISQGAEAIVFTTKTHPYLPTSKDSHTEYIIKYRPPKKYRHPQLDATLTKHRTIAEARLLQRLTNIPEIQSPGLIALDARNGIIWMEKVGYELIDYDDKISSLKNWLWRYNDNQEKALTEEIKIALEKVGCMIGKAHVNDVIHGDLTSSNIIITEAQEACLIDFGLSYQSALPEDKGVDLYVLDRAILSTHPKYAEQYNEWLMAGYERGYGKDKKSLIKLKEVLKRYEEVRLRGRKRSMLG
ncbi:hypothetical protein WICPIJ_001386 [Wickerhamomyces pijperi]|uniref:EKC/KEOPS complex subunit BUD32 n=1 Tax=Wickerhamomyces pijperi TaxID=599730 RepID=A0A9P8TPY8_WICPI|nr:hypothetical protein WICPIJ_001386 [Wickerhamomyces pijperi]